MFLWSICYFFSLLRKRKHSFKSLLLSVTIHFGLEFARRLRRSRVGCHGPAEWAGAGSPRVGSRRAAQEEWEGPQGGLDRQAENSAKPARSALAGSLRAGSRSWVVVLRCCSQLRKEPSPLKDANSYRFKTMGRWIIIYFFLFLLAGEMRCHFRYHIDVFLVCWGGHETKKTWKTLSL